MKGETSKLNESVATLRRDTRQQIESMNEKLVNVSKGMNEKLANVTESVNVNLVQITESMNESERLTSHVSEVESKSRNMVVRELSSFKQGVTEENLDFLQARVDTVSRNNDARLGEMSSRLEKIQEQLITASRNQNISPSVVVEPMEQSVSSRSSGQRPSSTPVVNFETRQESERIMDECDIRLSNHCSGSDHVPVVSVAIGNTDGEAHRPRELAELTYPQCPSHVLNDIVLPKFVDCHKQNVVHFLLELDDYYRLKSVPESLKLPIAVKAISDPHSKQWFTTVYKDLTNYEHFKRAFTELLWSPQIQSQVRSQLYQDRFGKNAKESMSSHFLKYSVLAANLSPRLSELDLVDAIAGHFPPYVQTALLSAGVRTVQDALTFLNKLETMEQADTDKGRPNPGSSPRTPNQNQSPNHHQNNYDKNRRNNHYVRNVRYQGNPQYEGNWRYQPNNAHRGPYTSDRGAGPGSHTSSQNEPNPSQLNPRASTFDPSAGQRQGNEQNNSRNHSENDRRMM
jgi:hypothetical protein